MRYVPWRVPPTSWTREFSPASATFVLLVWPALLVFGLFGLVVAAVAAVAVWIVMRSVRLHTSSGGTHELRPCRACGSDTISPVGLCPTHRRMAAPAADER